MGAMTIRQIRRSKEITQSEMAKNLGVHVNTYINWEKKPKTIPVQKAIDICNFLDVNILDVSF